jgi:Secretory lipase/Citrate transporter
VGSGGWSAWIRAPLSGSYFGRDDLRGRQPGRGSAGRDGFRQVDPLLVLLVVLILAGILGIARADQLAAGLSNAGVITVAAMLVIAKGVVQTGVVSRATWTLLASTSTGQQVLRRLSFPIGVASALINTTPLVALLIPAARQLDQTKRIPAREVLLPLAHVTTLFNPYSHQSNVMVMQPGGYTRAQFARFGARILGADHGSGATRSAGAQRALHPRDSEGGIPKQWRAWRILYTTTLDENVPAVASAVVIASSDRLAPGPRPVIAWAHGTTGVASQCAPSLLPSRWNADIIPGINHALARGWVIVATDYVGLGTAGPHPYLIGRGEARSVLDSVRAARQMPQPSLQRRTVIWGHSQGGHAALWAVILAPTYAPERSYVNHLCDSGQSVEYQTYRGRDHLSLLWPGSRLVPNLLAWTQARFAGRAGERRCSVAQR